MTLHRNKATTPFVMSHSVVLPCYAAIRANTLQARFYFDPHCLLLESTQPNEDSSSVQAKVIYSIDPQWDHSTPRKTQRVIKEDINRTGLIG